MLKFDAKCKKTLGLLNEVSYLCVQTWVIGPKCDGEPCSSQFVPDETMADAWGNGRDATALTDACDDPTVMNFAAVGGIYKNNIHNLHGKKHQRPNYIQIISKH